MNSKHFPVTLLKAFIIILIALALGLVSNHFSSHGISLKGSWSKKIISDSLIVPYSYSAGDPRAITISEAMTKYQSPQVIFLDARLEADFKAGHIKNALNLPYEELQSFWDKVSLQFSPEQEIITYCDGTECENSLYLARELRQRGFTKVLVFFGGWTEWKKAELPIE
jgi:rhodanese-related sulfurtransferase